MIHAENGCFSPWLLRAKATGRYTSGMRFLYAADCFYGAKIVASTASSFASKGSALVSSSFFIVSGFYSRCRGQHSLNVLTRSEPTQHANMSQ